MDKMMEAYNKVRDSSQNTMNESTGRGFYNRLNKALLEFYNINKEMKDLKQNVEVLDEMYESIKKTTNDWKSMVEERTGV